MDYLSIIILSFLLLLVIYYFYPYLSDKRENCNRNEWSEWSECDANNIRYRRREPGVKHCYDPILDSALCEGFGVTSNTIIWNNIEGLDTDVEPNETLVLSWKSFDNKHEANKTKKTNKIYFNTISQSIVLPTGSAYSFPFIANNDFTLNLKGTLILKTTDSFKLVSNNNFSIIIKKILNNVVNVSFKTKNTISEKKIQLNNNNINIQLIRKDNIITLKINNNIILDKEVDKFLPQKNIIVGNEEKGRQNVLELNELSMKLE